MRLYIPMIGVIAVTSALNACTTDYPLHADACLTKESIQGTATEVYADHIVVKAEDGSEFNVASEYLTRPTSVGDYVTLRRDVVDPTCGAAPTASRPDLTSTY